MDPFRTSLTSSSSNNSISLSNKVVTIGSCFSDTIGDHLKGTKIDSLVNPFGVIYNPHSIHKVLQHSILGKLPSKNTYLQRDDLFLNYDFHSAFCAPDVNNLERTLKTITEAAHSFLKNADWLMITYGTAWVYEGKSSGEIVANCHKMPHALFTKSLLSQRKILESFDSMFAALKSINPKIKVLLTVSPVRHLKDTLELNSVSKSVLRVACHTLTERYPDVTYFPAYEIMMDDLRDYRFYKADMIHPSEIAEEYIWQKFTETFFDETLITFLNRWKEIQSALSHKAFHPTSLAHQKFLMETLKKLQELKSLVNVDQEIELIKSQII